MVIHRICFIVIVMISLITSGMSQDKQPVQLFSGSGKAVKYKKLLKDAQQADVVLFGEYHNNAIAHWLQYELTADLIAAGPVVLGAEMFEADNQEPLNRYLDGEIDYTGLDTLARLWSNYKTDYAPLVDLAVAHNLPFAATNIPRRFASMVYHGGFEALDELSDEQLAWVAPLPIEYDAELPGYKAMLEMMGGHGGETLPMAQAIKDATMAHFILQYFREGETFIHYNGAYHSDNYEGILWYLKLQAPDLTYLTITTVEQSQLKSLDAEHKNRADYIIVVDEHMTKTY
ncbi:MAG: ChaN family lipoprotein [Saprospiraceae bacterium]